MANCRFCSAELSVIFADLGMSPLANSYVKAAEASKMEAFFPLRAYVCSACMLVQLEEFESPSGIFSDYAYFSSFSTSWLAHAERYVEAMMTRFGLNESAQVIEIASNDGYLLQYFQARGVPVLGIEPAQNVAKVATEKGIPSRTVFFSSEIATQLREEGLLADLLLGNNVYAHVPDLHSFTEGLRLALKPDGVITLEFPHLLRLMQESQFDTIYHEHFSYLSLITVQKVFQSHGLNVFDVEQLPTHGGSLRVFGKHQASRTHPVTAAVAKVLADEHNAGLHRVEGYADFAEKVKTVKCDLLEFLIKSHREGKTVAAYGAPAKGNTLLNYCGVGPEFIPYTVDRSPHKQSTLLPGTRIPVRDPAYILETKPDFVLILPWNLKDEITQQMSAVREWGGRFVVAIPNLQIF